MNIILLGPPGSGKGTQSNNLVEKYKLSHISTGDILRSQIAEKTKLGNAAKVYMDKGDLVPDNLIIDMVSNTTKTLQSILLDGFPRTINQAMSLEEEMKKNLLRRKNQTKSKVKFIRRGKKNGVDV